MNMRKIAVNALQDEEQAEKIVNWLQRDINSAWENRADIEPSEEGQKQQALLDVLKLLPKTNCKECGEPTCMVFAVRVIEGAKDHTTARLCRERKRERWRTISPGLTSINLQVCLGFTSIITRPNGCNVQF